MRTVGILQPSYLPWLGYFEQIHKSDIFVFYDDVQFEKGSWRNRNRIKIPGGAHWLTVPVLTRKQGFQKVHDILINSAVPWRKKHIKSIAQNYSKAPYFELYADPLFDIIDRPWQRLLDLNLESIAWLCKQLGIKTRTVIASELCVTGGTNQRLISIIRKLGGNIFYEGASGRNYVDVEAFEQAGISVQFQDYVHPEYSQLCGTFVPYLSVIDLLFNQGPDSLSIITGERGES